MLQQQTVAKIAESDNRQKIRSRQVGVCSVITEQNPAMNTFTITYSQSISHLHLPPKAKEQTKPPKMTEDGNNQQEIVRQWVGVCHLL